MTAHKVNLVSVEKSLFPGVRGLQNVIPLTLKLKSQVITCQTASIGTYIKVGSSVLQDELSGVRLVLTVVHIHLELISLKRRNNISTSLT